MILATHEVSEIGLYFLSNWRSFRPALKIGIIVARLHPLGVCHIRREIRNNVAMVGWPTTAGPASFSRQYGIPSGPVEFLLGNHRRIFLTSGANIS